MTQLVAYIRIEHPNHTPDSLDSYDNFEHLLDLFDSNDGDNKFIEIGTSLEIEGNKYLVVNIITQFKNNILNTSNPAYDYNIEIQYIVERVAETLSEYTDNGGIEPNINPN